MIKNWTIACIALCFIPLFSCFGVYDPPFEGRDIRILNQTNDGVYVFIDSFPIKNNYINWIDTSKVNGRKFLSNKLTYINAFDIGVITVSEAYLSSRSSKILTLYFLSDSLIYKQVSGWDDSNFRKQLINIDDLKKPSLRDSSLNIFFFYKDTIVRDYEFNMQSRTTTITKKPIKLTDV